MPTIAQVALADLDHELSQTRLMLERYPVGKNEFTPHDKSWPMIRLAAHVATLPDLGCIALSRSEIDFMAPMPERPAAPTDRDSLLAAFDRDAAAFKALLGGASDEAMMETWTMRAGAHVVLAMPRVAVLRTMVINHLVHHRAQLTIYYRLCGVPVPGLYGPSADDA